MSEQSCEFSARRLVVNKIVQMLVLLLELNSSIFPANLVFLLGRFNYSYTKLLASLVTNQKPIFGRVAFCIGGRQRPARLPVKCAPDL